MKTSFRRTSDLHWLNQAKLVANMMRPTDAEFYSSPMALKCFAALTFVSLPG